MADSAALRRVRAAARGRGATRLATALFLAGAAASAAGAAAVAASPELVRPTDSWDAIALVALLGAAAGAAGWCGTALATRALVPRLDAALDLGGLLEATAEGAARAGALQPLLEREVARVPLARARRALELPWPLALAALGAGAWCLVGAVEAARPAADGAVRRALAARAAEQLAAAGTLSDDASFELARLAREADRAARDTGAGDAEALEHLAAELARLAPELGPTDPRSTALEAARLAIDAGLAAPDSAADRNVGGDPSAVSGGAGAVPGEDAGEGLAPGAGEGEGIAERAGAALPGAAAPARTSGAGEPAGVGPAGAAANRDGVRLVPASAGGLTPEEAAVVARWLAMRRESP